MLTRVGPDCGSVQPLYRLTSIHLAPLWLRGGRRRVATGHSEVGGQGVGLTQGHPPHVFGPELLSP